jgi:hypothetical protein
LPKFHNVRNAGGRNHHELLDSRGEVTRRQMSVTLNHAQSTPAAEFLNGSLVYPGRDETGSEGVPERVPRHGVETNRLRDRSAVRRPHPPR